MNKTIVFLFFLIVMCCILSGCGQSASISAGQTNESTADSDVSSEADTNPSVDLTKIIGRTEYDLITADPKSEQSIIYHAQTNLGDLLADAYRNSAGADAAFVCAGEIGAGIPAGNICISHIYDVFPEESGLITVEASGKQILDCLEIAYRLIPDSNPDYIHLSGITLAVDMNIPSPVKTDEIGDLTVSSGARRVQDVRLGGTPLRENEIYTLTFSASASPNIADIFKNSDSVCEDSVSNHEALISYISDSLSGEVSDKYKNTFGNRRLATIPLGRDELPSPSALLPQVYITTENTINRFEYVSCSIALHDPTGVFADIYDTQSTVKIRGNSTSVGEKSPYNIKFSEKEEVLGLGNGKKWNLLANLYDKTQLRNTLAYTLAQSFGINYISNSCFTEVYLNGEYIGLYQICEPVGVSKTRVDIDTEKNEYLLEVEPYEWYSNPYFIKTPNFNILLGYNEPEIPTAEQQEWLKNFISTAEIAMLSGNYNEVKKIVDVESFARCYIVQELFKNIDYIQSSTRFYVKDNKLYEGPVWDFDLSSGNCSSSFYPEYNNVGTSGLSYESLYCVSLFNRYLFEYEDFRKLVSDLYREFQPKIINLYQDNELGECMIDRLVNSNREAIDRNNAIWTTKWGYSIYEHTPIDGTYDGEISFLKNWLEMRNLWLYNYYCLDYN